MRITQTEPLDYVSRKQYERDRTDRFQLVELEPDPEYDEEYKARAIVNERSDDKYAADFLVVVNEIIRPKKRRFNLLASQVIKISLSPVDLDGNILEEEDVQPVREDGTTYTSTPLIMNRLEIETGYFLSPEDSIDKELTEILSNPVDNPSIPMRTP